MNFYQKLTLLLALFMFSYANAKDIYVTKNGNDSNTGTIDSPYLTISKAAAEAEAGDVVYIGNGTYEETIRPANSGSNGLPITFTSIPGERVIISGMEALSGWTQDGGSIYKTTVTWDLGQENFVLHNSTALDLARWPNNEDGEPFTQNTVRNTGGSNADAFSSRKGNLTASNIPNIDWTGGALFFYGDSGGAGWLAWKEKITSSSSGQVNFDITKNAGVNWIYTRHAPADLGEFYLEGVKGALDFKNEWWFDVTTKELFVQLPSGAEPQDGAVQMRRRTTAIDLNSRNFITIKDLAVFGGSIKVGDFGQESNNNVLTGISSFYGSHTQGILTNFNSGKASVKIRGNNNVVDRCEISFGAASGLNLAGNFNEVKNTNIHDFDYIGSYDAPLVVRGIYDTKITGNNIYNGGRDCISYFGQRNEFSFNDIHRSNLISDDCGLFYTTGRQESTEIHHNWFHDTYSTGDKFKATGIYLDNDGSSFSVHHNVVWNTEWTGIQINWSGEDIDVFNNTFFNNERGTMGAWHKEGTAFARVRVWNNLGGDDKWEPQSDKQNNFTVDGSVFSSSDNGDFRLKSGSSPIDAGRVIDGFTDDFVGANPDAGAYEFGGDDWVPGIDWDPRLGPAGLGCYGLPGEDCVVLPANDADGDGVGDENDQCPNTPANTTVDTTGCPVFTLPADNFTLLVTGETCRSSNNGSISITAKENLNYTATIEGSSTQKNFTEETLFEDLSQGTYTICITTTGDADYKQCFSLEVVEPENLSVKSDVNIKSNQVTLNLEGSDLYRIELNDIVTVTDQSEITLNLRNGVNNLLVKTNKDCQGIHQEKIVANHEGQLFPNPVKDILNITIREFNNEPVRYELFSTSGQLVLSKNLGISKGLLTMNLSEIPTGIYFVSLSSSNYRVNSKIIKQ